MANIESIKQKILQLDAGSFQNLCDSYLYKIGYPNIVSLGGEAGTRKTTPGTPDTYFIASNGKYVFVEYTTQKTSLFAKIKDDLEKCLDTSKTGVPHDKISEIIYCHTSSNLTPFQDSEVKALCENIGIKLTVIGIDKLAEDIYLFHHNLSRDFLGISISTGQIQSYDDFINSYNSNRMAAPIDTKFLFREKEFKDIGDAYVKADVVILNGPAGACNSNRLDSINDVSQLYEDYYGSTLEDNQLLVNKNMCITAGIVAFLEAIHLEHMDAFLPILNEKGLNRDDFIENIRMLHELEIVDICNDKAVRFSDQCLSNYLLKYVFFDKKLLSLSKMIKACFQSYRERTISSVNTLLNIFRNETLFSFVEKEIKLLWDELSTEKSQDFFEFVKVFFRVNPTETLLILQDKIEAEKRVICEWSDIEKGKNYQSVTSDIIKILGGFADMTDLPTACDLFFQYYFKRPDLYMEFYHAVNLYFGVNKDSAHYGFYTQVTFFEKMKEYSDDWKQESVAILFLQIAEEFLKLHFSPAEGGRKNTLTVYQIPLTISEGVENYRKLIWESLSSLCEIEKYRAKVRKVLSSYGGIIEDISIPVLQFDLKYIESILKAHFPPEELGNCLLVNKIAHVFSCMNISCETVFAKYFAGRYFQLYLLLKGPDYTEEVGYEKCKQLKQQAINQYVSNCDLEMFKKLIDVCNDISEFDDHTSWEVGEGLGMAFDTISLKKDCYVDAIKYYIEKDTPNNLHPYHLSDILFPYCPI